MDQFSAVLMTLCAPNIKTFLLSDHQYMHLLHVILTLPVYAIHHTSPFWNYILEGVFCWLYSMQYRVLVFFFPFPSTATSEIARNKILQTSSKRKLHNHPGHPGSYDSSGTRQLTVADSTGRGGGKVPYLFSR